MHKATWSIVLGIVLVIPITTFPATPAAGETGAEVSFAAVSPPLAPGDNTAALIPAITRLPMASCAVPAPLHRREGCLCQWDHDGCWGLVVQSSGWILGINCGDGYQYWFGSGRWGGTCRSIWECF